MLDAWFSSKELMWATPGFGLINFFFAFSAVLMVNVFG
jgi:hypothetical protein